MQPNRLPAHPIGRNMSVAVLDQRLQLMHRASAGDGDSFATLIEPLLDPAYRLAAVMLADRGAAEDAVQEASIKAWRKLKQLRGDPGSLKPWFLSIVANECRMTRRTRWWSVVRMPELPGDERGSASAMSSDLHSALLRLSPNERLPLVLHFFLDLPLEEVARTLGVSPSAAKSRIYRAAQRLRSDITLEEVF
jgi:RNA polymerase sigma-70 factor (ECF subfamily)